MNQEPSQVNPTSPPQPDPAPVLGSTPPQTPPPYGYGQVPPSYGQPDLGQPVCVGSPERLRWQHILLQIGGIGHLIFGGLGLLLFLLVTLFSSYLIPLLFEMAQTGHDEAAAFLKGAGGVSTALVILIAFLVFVVPAIFNIWFGVVAVKHSKGPAKVTTLLVMGGILAAFTLMGLLINKAFPSIIVFVVAGCYLAGAILKRLNYPERHERPY